MKVIGAIVLASLYCCKAYQIDSEEYDVLLNFKSLCNSPELQRNWCESECANNNRSSTNPCDWKGVTCEQDHDKKVSHVVGIDLKSSNLSCELSALNLHKLPQIKSIVLSDNKISGELPDWLGAMKYLNSLILTQNEITGNLPEFFFLYRVRNVSIAENLMTQTNEQIANFVEMICLYGLDLSVRNTLGPLNIVCACAPNAIVDLTNGQCSTCPAGTQAVGYSKYVSIKCQPCEIGMFNPGGVESFCEPCPPGQIAPNTGSATCTKCPPGKFATLNNNTCDECPVGTFSFEEGTAVCTKCPKGTISGSKPGRSTCIECPKGTFMPYEGGKSECKKCLPGSFSKSVNSSVCSLCPPNQFMSESGAQRCHKCPGVTPNATSASTTCQACIPGYYKNPRTLQCEQCKFGEVSGRLGEYECAACWPGSASSDRTSCTLCPRGSFASESGQIDCTTCPEGFLTLSRGSTQCLEPPAALGHEYKIDRYYQPLYLYEPKVSLVPILAPETEEPCQPGFFNDGSFLRCEPCPAGKFAPKSGMDSCNDCFSGYNSKPGSFKCELNPPGTFTPYDGLEKPELCPVNTFASEFGSTSCMPCSFSNKTYATWPGSANCTTAKANEMLRNVTWPIARITSTISGDNNNPVLNPSAKNITIEQELLKLAFWHTLSEHNLPRCGIKIVNESKILTIDLIISPPPVLDTNSMLRSVQNVFKTRYFVDAFIGRCTEFGRTWSEKNPQGDKVFQAWSLRTINVTLLPNTYVNTTVASVCIPGTFAVNDTCVECPSGSYSSQPGQKKCRLCPYGKFNNETGMAKCNRCQGGYYTLNLGDSECTACPAITFDLSNNECRYSLYFSLGLLLLVLYVISIPSRNRMMRNKRQRDLKARRFKYSLLEVHRANAKSVNETYRAPMGTVSARSLAGLVHHQRK